MSTLSKFSFYPRSLLSLKIPCNMTESQMWFAFSGALLLSLSACLYYIVFGKVLGRKSVFSSFREWKFDQNQAVKITVLAGIIFSAAFVKELYHEHYIDFYPFDSKSYTNRADETVLVIAGFLVGIGTALAGSCTFCHILNGLPRKKLASFLSLILFAVAAYTTTSQKLSRRIHGLYSELISLDLGSNISSDYYINACLVLPFIFFVCFKDKSIKGLTKYIISFVIGVVCCLGMMIGGLTQRSLVIEGASFNPRYWNPTIVLFLLGSAILNWITMGFILKSRVTPVFSTEIQNEPENVNVGLIVGSICFGIGWALSGLCTASIFAFIPLVDLKIPFYWGISCFVGFKIGELLQLTTGKILELKKRF